MSAPGPSRRRQGSAGGSRAKAIVPQEKSQLRERAEAIHAADVALRHLRASAELLDSAHDWGTFDMFIGGIFSSLIKHKRIADAEEEFRAARDAVRRFARELDDVDDVDPGFNIGGLVGSIDIFFDNVIADIFVQYKINKAQKRVALAIAQIEQIRAYLMDV